MEALASFVAKYHKIIPIAGIVLFALSIIAANNIQVKTQVKDLLPEDNPQVQMYEEVSDRFFGGTSVRSYFWERKEASLTASMIFTGSRGST
ncbi:MAG: hypothetical protein ACUVXI_05580 [bacterium]